ESQPHCLPRRVCCRAQHLRGRHRRRRQVLPWQPRRDHGRRRLGPLLPQGHGRGRHHQRGQEAVGGLRARCASRVSHRQLPRRV
ncbi:hypothetical protein BN1708_020689, partial [Verticillium longisporum]